MFAVRACVAFACLVLNHPILSCLVPVTQAWDVQGILDPCKVKIPVIKFSNQPTASVTRMLSDLGWSSLETRRTIARLSLLYKICHGIVDIDQSSYLHPHTNCDAKTCLSHDYKFLNVNATKDVYFYSFFPRTLRMWNKLPKDIVESDSLET